MRFQPSPSGAVCRRQLRVGEPLHCHWLAVAPLSVASWRISRHMPEHSDAPIAIPDDATFRRFAHSRVRSCRSVGILLQGMRRTRTSEGGSKRPARRSCPLPPRRPLRLLSWRPRFAALPSHRGEPLCCLPHCGRPVSSTPAWFSLQRPRRRNTGAALSGRLHVRVNRPTHHAMPVSPFRHGGLWVRWRASLQTSSVCVASCPEDRLATSQGCAGSAVRVVSTVRWRRVPPSAPAG